MLVFLCTLGIASSTSFHLTKLPSAGSSPNALSHSTAVYNNYTNQIYVFGGQTLESEKFSSSIYSFDLDTFTWDEIFYASQFSPLGMIFSNLILRSTSKLLVLFGSTFNEIVSECYSFDLELKTWKIEELKGDKVLGRIGSASCEFEYKGAQYFAMYGGVTVEGETDELVLFDIQTLTAKKVETENGPGFKAEASLVFYKDSLFLYQGSTMHKLDLESLIWTSIEIDLGSTLKYHKSFVVSDSMNVFFGYNPSTLTLLLDVFQINLTDYSTNKVFTDDSPVINQASVQISSSIYFLFGQGVSSYLNSITKYEIEENSIEKTVIVKSASFPSKRRNHVSFQYGNEIYIFGGISSTGEYLNDMWKFNIEENIWIKLTTIGAIPEARELMASFYKYGIGYGIYGGRSSNLYSNIYFFQPKDNYWLEITPENNAPPARYSSCISDFLLKVIIIGGRNENMIFSDIWVYDFLSNNFTQIIDNDPNFKLIGHNCKLIEKSSDIAEIYIFGGSNYEYIPNRNIYKVQISGFNSFQFKVSTEILLSSPHLTFSESPFIPNSDYFMLLSGSDYRNYIIPSLGIYNVSTNTLEFEELPSQLALFGHSAVHMGKSIYIFGGGLSNSGYKIDGSTSNTFYKLTWDELRCGYGSEGTNCEPCNKGFTEISGKCSPCVAGTYSDNYGTVESVGCNLCKYGTFNDKTGVSYCKECSKNYFCPIGSKTSKIFQSNMIPSSRQPENYNGPDDIFYLIQNILWYGSLGILIFCTVTVFTIKPLKNKIKLIDLFANSSSQDNETPAYNKKTVLGGMFSFYFLTFAFVTILLSILMLVYDNVSEIKTLVPITTISEDIKSSTLNINIKLFDFNGICVKDGKCINNKIDIAGISYASRDATCNLVESVCFVSVIYVDFKVIGSGFFNLTFNDWVISATLFTVEVEATSSIPGENSYVFVPVYSDSKDKLFRGFIATVVSFEFIPSIFKTDTNKWSKFNTGYHIRYKSPYSLGSTVIQNEFYVSAYLIISLKFEQGSTVFITKRLQIYSWNTFILTLLGSLFGLMGLFSSGLGFVEYIEEKLFKFLKKRRILRKMLKNRKKIYKNFKKPPLTTKVSESTLIRNTQ